MSTTIRVDLELEQIPPDVAAWLRNRCTPREAEVLRLAAEGLTAAEIAAQMYVSERTVKNAIHDVCKRVGLRNRCHAVAWACRNGII